MVKIVLDAGHGGYDGGASANGLKEKNLTLDIVKRIKKGLSKYKNVSVKLTRSTDKYVSLSKRADIANNWDADLFVSVHINAGGGQGYEDYRHPSQSVSSKTAKFQRSLYNAITTETGFKKRGFKTANFAVLRLTRMPAVLTENGFIDNKSDANKLKKASFLERVAQGHVKGIVNFLGLKRKSSKKIVKKTSSNKKSTYTGGSIVDYLKAKGIDSSFSNRKRLAQKHGIKNYKGTTSQNIKLLNILKGSKSSVGSKKKKSSYVGKRVESIHNGNLRFYARPSWKDKDVVGYVKKGYGFPTIVSKVKVGKGYQYKVKNSKGKVFYITASPKYVKVI